MENPTPPAPQPQPAPVRVPVGQKLVMNMNGKEYGELVTVAVFKAAGAIALAWFTIGLLFAGGL